MVADDSQCAADASRAAKKSAPQELIFDGAPGKSWQEVRKALIAAKHNFPMSDRLRLKLPAPQTLSVFPRITPR